MFAHSAILNVSYDACCGDKYNDDVLEGWYALTTGDGICHHLSHEETTIKYYFAESARNNANDTWVSLIRETSSTEISTEAAQ